MAFHKERPFHSFLHVTSCRIERQRTKEVFLVGSLTAFGIARNSEPRPHHDPPRGVTIVFACALRFLKEKCIDIVF